MAEANVGTAIPGEDPGSDAAPAIADAVKEKARGLGWRPKTEWEGEPGDWVSAKEFLGRQSLFDKIRAQKDDLYHLKRENTEMKRDLGIIKNYVKQMSDTEYKRALADLRVQKAEAVREADAQKVAALDEEMDNIKDARKEIDVAPAVQAPAPPPEFFEWKAKNDWYDKDIELQEFANDQGAAILARNKTLPPAEVLRQVEQRVKKMYPEKFGGKSAPKVQAVEAGGGSPSVRTSKAGKLTKGDLDDMQRKAMDAFVKRGVLTEEQYLDSLSKNR